MKWKKTFFEFLYPLNIKKKICWNSLVTLFYSIILIFSDGVWYREIGTHGTYKNLSIFYYIY